jgi:Flp pilus assembly protein TadD
MRQFIVFALAGPLLLGLSACGEPNGQAEVDRAMRDLNLMEENSITQMMLTVAAPAEAIAFFTSALQQTPNDIKAQRGLAASLIRANRNTEGVAAWRTVLSHPEAGPDDSVEMADALIRNNQWSEAQAMLNMIPPTHETFKRYRLEAMVADANEQWDKADSFYEIAVGLTTTPAGVLNNWGYSKLTRGDYRGAERLFTDALRHEPGMFTAKNNLVLARGAQRNYDLPVIPMTQTERAQLLYTMALTAIKQNDVTIGKGLLKSAIDTHPQHFDEAVRALRAIES